MGPGVSTSKTSAEFKEKNKNWENDNFMKIRLDRVKLTVEMFNYQIENIRACQIFP